MLILVGGCGRLDRRPTRLPSRVSSGLQ
jgi:hypothetical protein